ncbi:MAG TPA: hypothetical protein VF989_11870 [Polyangiaceae bacterium]|jgi:hypothetical protein
MAVDPVVRELVAIAERLGLRVRIEPFHVRGAQSGLCRVKGKLCVLVDELASSLDQATSLADVLAPLEVDSSALSAPAARLLRTRRERLGVRPEDTREKPGLVGLDPRGNRRTLR